MAHKFITKVFIYNLGRGFLAAFCHDFGELLSKRQCKTGQNICSDSHKSFSFIRHRHCWLIVLFEMCWFDWWLSPPPYRAATQASAVYWQGDAVSRRHPRGRCLNVFEFLKNFQSFSIKTTSICLVFFCERKHMSGASFLFYCSISSSISRKTIGLCFCVLFSNLYL